MRHECNVRAFNRGNRGAADERVLISVASGDAPLRSNKTVESQLVSIRTLTAGLQDPRRVVWISGSRIGAVLPVERRGKSQVTADIPLHSEFVVREFFRFDLLGDGCQLRKLIAGARQVSDAVIRVHRDCGDWLDDDTCAR